MCSVNRRRARVTSFHHLSPRSASLANLPLRPNGDILATRVDPPDFGTSKRAPMAAVGLVDVSDVARTATAAGVVEPVPTVGVLPSVGTHLFIVRESTSKTFESSPAGKPRLLDQVRAAVRTRHYSPRTEKAYIGWIRRYVVFHGKRHPSEMGEAEKLGS